MERFAWGKCHSARHVHGGRQALDFIG